MEDSDSSDFYEAEPQEFEDEVEVEVEQSFLDLEPISEAEQSSFCIAEIKEGRRMSRMTSYFCDITLVAKEGNEFKAHRNVLSAASPFFSKLLQSEMKEKEEGVIRFEEISKPILSDVLEFIYTGSVKINEKNARDLIIAADYLLLESLKIISGRFLEEQMSTYNCISTFLFAERYRCDELVLRSTKFIQDNFTSAAKSDEFLNLEAEEVEKWISSENILVAAEEDVFRIILNWIEQNKRERKDKFERLFRHVRLVLLSRDFLFSDIVTNELVTEHFSILRRVTDAIKSVSAATEDAQIQPARRRLETDAIVVRGGKTTYCYLPEKDEWKRLADGLSEDRNHTTQLIKFRDQLYSFPGSRYAETERYEPAFNSWTTLKLSLPFEKVSLAVLNGKIHAIYRDQSAPVIERYDMELCAWETLTSSQDFHYRDNSCVVAVGNCLYVLGGGYSDKAGRFDTAERKWEEIASMQPKLMINAFGVATQGKIFVCDSHTSVCTVYEVSRNEWQPIASIDATRFRLFSLVCLNETVYVVGHSSQPDEMIVVKSYDPKLGKWIQKTSIPINK
ncbi:unnamed protein product, partial [Porites evermanni]